MACEYDPARKCARPSVYLPSVVDRVTVGVELLALVDDSPDRDLLLEGLLRCVLRLVLCASDDVPDRESEVSVELTEFSKWVISLSRAPW